MDGPKKDRTIVRDLFETVGDFQLSMKVSFPPVFSEVKRLLPGYVVNQVVRGYPPPRHFLCRFLLQCENMCVSVQICLCCHYFDFF